MQPRRVAGLETIDGFLRVTFGGAPGLVSISAAPAGLLTLGGCAFLESVELLTVGGLDAPERQAKLRSGLCPESGARSEQPRVREFR
jgi:hypothetical protein